MKNKIEVIGIGLDGITGLIEETRILIEKANLDDDEKKMTIDELNDFANQLTHYKKQNIKPTKVAEGFER